MNAPAPCLGQMFNFFSVNTCGKASNTFRFDSNFCALVVVSVCITLTQFGLICHTLLLLLFSFSSPEANIHFSTPFHYKQVKDQCGYRKCSLWGSAWVHTDKWWICSSSCFHNDVKWNVKWSKVPAPPIQKFVCWACQACFPLNRFFVVVFCFCVCVYVISLLGQTFHSSRSTWF